MKRSENKQIENKIKLSLKDFKFKKSYLVIPAVAVIGFMSGSLYPHTPQTSSHFSSNSEQTNAQLKELKATETKLSEAKKNLDKANADYQKASDGSKKAKETIEAINADIKEKQGTQDSLFTSINDLKDKKESLEDQINTEKTVQPSSTSVDGSAKARADQYHILEKLVRSYDSLKSIDISTVAGVYSPAYTNMVDQFDKYPDDRDKATQAFIDEKPIQNLTNEQTKQLACLEYDFVNAINNGTGE